MHASTIVRVPFCGLPCSPLRIDAIGAGGWTVAGGCGVARAAAGRAPDRGGPRVGGRPAGLDAALDRAAAILAAARRPHVGGLAWSTIGAVRRAARIARRLGATLDIEGGSATAAESEAIAIAGLASATFGAVRARADVVLLWRCDPLAEHPGLLPGRLPAAAGGGERRFVRLGAAGPAEPGDLEALAALRALALGRAPHLAAAPPGTRAGGLPVEALRDAAAAVGATRHAAILWDAQAVNGPTGAAVALALALLARDLNDARDHDDSRRAVARPLGGGGNIAGALAAVLSEVGHARDLGPVEGADALLLVGPRERGTAGAAAATPAAAAPAVAASAMAAPGSTTPAPVAGVVVIGPRLPEGREEPDVFLPTAVPGLSGGGLWMRADGIALPVRDVVPRTAPLEEEILDALTARLPDERGAGAPR